jgi:hypothetical protein
MVILLCGAVAAGCLGGPPAASQERCPCLAKDIEIANGKSAVIESESLEIRFEGVGNDSRCPINARCVWEGDAAVTIELTKPGQQPGRLELHTSGRFEQEGRYLSYHVRLSALQPEPQTDRPIAPSDYRATVVVTR